MIDNNKLLKFALDAGEIMIASGAETSRVEDTMQRILSKSNAQSVEALCGNTFLFASLVNDDTTPITLVRAIKDRSVNFEKICGVNHISRNFVSEKVNLEDSIKELHLIEQVPTFPPLIRIISHGFASGGFTMVLSGTWIDGSISFFLGVILGALLVLSEDRKIPFFLLNLVGGIFSGFFATLFQTIVPTPDLIIIGTITPLLPGRIMTNSIRDMLESNFLCGSTQLIESLLIGVAIAGGVGIGVNFANTFF